MKKLVFGAALAAATLIGGSMAYSLYAGNPREPTAYYIGHRHQHDATVGAPSHGGGLDRYGCHNASVPYHCH